MPGMPDPGNCRVLEAALGIGNQAESPNISWHSRVGVGIWGRGQRDDYSVYLDKVPKKRNKHVWLPDPPDPYSKGIAARLRRVPASSRVLEYWHLPAGRLREK